MYTLQKTFLILFLFISSFNFTLSQQEDAQAEEMKVWTEYMTPSSMHEMMAKSAGDWKTINKYWMDPSGEAMVTEGTAKIEMILGGRYQVSNHAGIIMGMPMEGMSLMGYDNATQEFTAVWVDNVGTGIAIAKGKYDESTKTITMDGTMVDPISKADMNFKQYMKIIDDNHQTLEMFLIYNGQEFKSLEIEYIRQ